MDRDARGEDGSSVWGTAQDAKSHRPFPFLAGSLEKNCEAKLLGIVTTPTGNMNCIEQNLDHLLKSQPKPQVN